LKQVRRISGLRAGTPLIALLLAACLAAPPVAFAVPATPQIRAKQARAAQASAKLQDMSDDLEGKVEEYNAVTEALAKTRGDIEGTARTLEETEAKLARSQATLAERAEAIYRTGSVDMLEVLLGTSDFDDFLSRLDILNRISGQDADLVSQVSGDRDRVAQTQTALENRESEQIALRTEAAAKKQAVESAVAEQAAYVASLNADIKRLIKDEEARQARIAAELARQAATRGSGRGPAQRSGDVSKLGAPHPDALAVAKRYVGVPYVWGGTNPSGFDCSGLCQYAYAAIGISLPRTSRSMYRVGNFIPAARTDLLEPGDLVFFGYGGDPGRVHHVGMYAGNGVFLHAPGTGGHVKYSSLTDRIRSRGDYVGAVRP
jgi:cell wall-associated NlpC family hydrolase